MDFTFFRRIIKNQMFKIGPNPTADLLSVSYELNDLSSVIFEVYDMMEENC